MLHQTAHAVLPKTSHDELSRQEFAFTVKSHISTEVGPGNRDVADARVVPGFVKAMGRSPQTRIELRDAMNRDPYHQMWGALTRLAQEVMWDSVEESVSRQLPVLNAAAKHVAGAGGSLELDPALKVPRYVSAVDIHVMPGGYASEAAPDDVRAGAIFDRGTFINVCGTQGPLHDARGRTVCSYLRYNFPSFRPQRILDMGCSVGQATTAFPKHFPDAEVHAIDVAAPLLRYGHARAEGLGLGIHFSQQNAEATHFADESFDLVVSHLLFHETSTTALTKIIAECRRILRPGGMMIHLELGLPYKDMTLYDQVIHDWQTLNNAEPFWAKINATDTAALARKIGFATATSGYLQRSEHPESDKTTLGPKPADTDAHPQGARVGCEVFFVMQGVK
ncbi:MAG: class I SAM-dependent methyltransferase [Proteobacteria bacterium]|nr:class I SAM-dependent methyltransferase [Pseudomonadota bacterium]